MHDSEAMAKQWFEQGWNQREEKVHHDLAPDDAVGYSTTGERMTMTDFYAWRESMLEAFPDMRIVVDDVIADGGRVAIRWSFTGTHRGQWMDVAATGREIEAVGSTWWKVEDGRIVEGRDFWDLGALARELEEAS